MPFSHCDAYTVPDWLCQKTATAGLFFKRKSRKACASSSENGALPPLTVFDCHVLFGCHLQSKLRLRSTSSALNRPDARICALVETSAIVKRPSLPVTLYTPSGFASGITVT